MTTFIASVAQNAESPRRRRPRARAPPCPTWRGRSPTWPRSPTRPTASAPRASEDAKSGGEAVARTIDGMKTISENMENTARVITGLGKRSQEIGQDPRGDRGDRRPDEPPRPERRHRGGARGRGRPRLRGGRGRGAQARRALGGGGQGDRRGRPPGAAGHDGRGRGGQAPGAVGDQGGHRPRGQGGGRAAQHHRVGLALEPAHGPDRRRHRPSSRRPPPRCCRPCPT